MYRALGWLSLAMAVAVVVHHGLAWWTEGAFHLSGLGDLWSQLDVGSLSDAQAALPAGLWDWVVRPVLALPALPAFLVLGLLLLWLGNRGPAAAPDMLGGLRPPRRRRRGRSELL